MRTSPSVVAARVLAGIAALGCGPVVAAPVSVTGGFTSFSGVVFGFDQTLINGTVVCPDAGCSTNNGVANVTFSSPQSSLVFENLANAPNGVSFTPAAPQEVNGTGSSNPFLLGTLTYTNGIWNSDSTFGFELTTDSLDPSLGGKSLTDTLVLRLTPNDFINGTPDNNADFVYFSGNPLLGSVRAYELQDSPTGSNVFSVDVLGYIDSLHLSAFINPQGGGFVDPGIDITPTPVPVPEPSTVSLMLIAGALTSVPLVRRRRAVRLAYE